MLQLPGRRVLKLLLKVFAWIVVSAFLLLAVGIVVAAVLPKDLNFTATVHPPVGPTQGAPDTIVVLVHGTFAPRAEWTMPNSALVQAIRQHLDGVAIEFVRFEWDGYFGGTLNNTHFHRYAAGQALGALLLEARRNNPAARIYVVAHSHAGNIAVYAAALGTHVDGIVTMGTPFIILQPRDFEADVSLQATTHIVAFVIWLAIIIGSQIAGLAALYAGFNLLDRRWFVVKVFGWTLLIFGFASGSWPVKIVGSEQVWVQDYSSHGGAGHYETRFKSELSEAAVNLRTSTDEKLLSAIRDWWSKTGAQSARHLTAYVPAGVPMLCVTTDEPDEALVALNQVVPTLDIPLRILRDPVLATVILNIAMLVCVGAGLTFGTMASVEMFRQARNDGELGPGTVAFGLISGGMIAYATSTFFVLTAGVVLGFLAPLSVILRAPASIPDLLSYGSSDIMAEYTTNVRVSPVPFTSIGEPACETMTYHFATPKSLAHSEYYQNPKSIEGISTWLGARQSVAR
jgi:hypothetical protein